MSCHIARSILMTLSKSKNKTLHFLMQSQPGPSLDTCSSVFSIMSQLEGGGTAPLDNEHLRSVDTGVFMGTRISTLS